MSAQPLEIRMAHLEGAYEQISDRLNGIDGRLTALDQKIDTRFDALDQKIDTRFDALDQKMDTRFDAFERKMDARFAAIDRRFQDGDARFQSIDRRFDSLDKKIAYSFVAGLTVNAATLAAVLGAVVAGHH